MHLPWRPTCLLGVLLIALGAAPAVAAEYYDARNGFTLTLPPGWSQRGLAPFEAIVSSFRFEEGRGYSPRRGIPREWLLVFLFGVICFHGWRRASRREEPARGPLPLEPEPNPEKI